MSTIPIPTGGPLPPRLDKYQLLEEEYQRVRDELTQARATLEKYDHDLRRRNEELRQASQYIDHLQHENQRWKDSFNDLQKELNDVQQQLPVEDAEALSEVSGKELFDAQIFLTKADTLSILEVEKKVTALNEEISRLAATLGDAYHYRHELSQTDMDAASVVSQEMLGKKMTNSLIALSQKQKPEVNPQLVQVVLQILIVKFCVSKIQPWYPGGDSSIGGFLSAIYSEIHTTTEEQAVPGRWRALTPADTRPSTEKWKKELYNNVVSVLKIASWKAVRHRDSFKNRLPYIINAINELRMAISENFTSADLDLFIFECDKIYDPAIMEDAYGDGKQSSGKRAPETIGGTTGIGLGKFIAEGSAKGVLQIRVQSLIPAKIVLTSTMNEALEPIVKSTRFKKKEQVETIDGANQDGRD